MFDINELFDTLKMKIIKCTILFASVALFIGCVSVAKPQDQAIAACDAAEASRKTAAKVGMEWTTTSGLIKKGKGSIEEGNFDAAIKTCNKAKFEADASIQQAKTESKLWQSRIPK